MSTCSICGKSISEWSVSKVVEGERYHQKCWKNLSQKDKARLEDGESFIKEVVPKCPRCGSKQLQATSVGETKGFSTGKGCCGAVLLGPFGWLCGLIGMGESKIKAKRVCMKCGNTF